MESQGDPGPSTLSNKRTRISTTRSHSSPSLTHWIGTPNGGMKRSWNPSTSAGIPSLCIDDKNGVGKVDKGNGKGKGREVGVEDGLSQLYVNHEKQEASSPSPTKNKKRSPTKRNVDVINPPNPSDLLTVLPNQPDISKKDEPQQSKGWTSSLFGNALNVGVFGAALGLTAYRILSNQPPSKSEDETSTAEDVEVEGGDIEERIEVEVSEGLNHEANDHSALGNNQDNPILQESGNLVQQEVSKAPSIGNQEEAQGLAQIAEQLQNPVPVVIAESDLPPPPAYEETVAESRRENGVRKEWEDIDEQPLTPAPSRLSITKSKSSLYLTYPYSTSPSPSSRRKRKNQIRRYKSSRNGLLLNHPLTNSRSLPSIEIHDCEPLPLLNVDNSVELDVALPTSNPGINLEEIDKQEVDRNNENLDENHDEEDDDDEKTKETIARLDSMSIALKTLIEQGKKALESTPGLGTTPGWEDEEIENDLFSPEYKSRRMKGQHVPVNPILQLTSRSSSPALRPSSSALDSPSSSIINPDITPIKRSSSLKRESKIPMKIGSNLNLRQSPPKIDNSKHQKVGSSSEFEVLPKSKIPVRSKSMVSGLNNA